MNAVALSLRTTKPVLVTDLAPLPAVADNHLDADFIARCRRFLDALNVIEQTDFRSNLSDEAAEVIDDEISDAEEGLLGLRPGTIEGRQAHAQVAFAALLWKIFIFPDTPWQEQCNADERLALEFLATAARVQLS